MVIINQTPSISRRIIALLLIVAIQLIVYGQALPLANQPTPSDSIPTGRQSFELQKKIEDLKKPMGYIETFKKFFNNNMEQCAHLKLAGCADCCKLREQMMDTHWYYLHNSCTCKPYDAQTLAKLASKTTTPATLVDDNLPKLMEETWSS